MPGFFDGLDSAIGDAVAEAEVSSFSDPAQGTYNFDVVGAEMKVGTKNNPDALNFIIHYTLTGDDDKPITYNQWLGIPQPANPRELSDSDRVRFSVLKQTLLALGVDESEINSVGPDDIEGVTGTLQIVYTKPKKPQANGREYFVNVRNIKADVAKAAPAQVTTKPASRKAAPKQVSGDVAPDDTNGSGTTATKPQMPSAVGNNPFAR